MEDSVIVQAREPVKGNPIEWTELFDGNISSIDFRFILLKEIDGDYIAYSLGHPVSDCVPLDAAKARCQALANLTD